MKAILIRDGGIMMVRRFIWSMAVMAAIALYAEPLAAGVIYSNLGPGDSFSPISGWVVATLASQDHVDPLCANMTETLAPLFITVEGQEGTSHEKVRKCPFGPGGQRPGASANFTRE